MTRRLLPLLLVGLAVAPAVLAAPASAQLKPICIPWDDMPPTCPVQEANEALGPLEDWLEDRPCLVVDGNVTTPSERVRVGPVIVRVLSVTQYVCA